MRLIVRFGSRLSALASFVVMVTAGWAQTEQNSAASALRSDSEILLRIRNAHGGDRLGQFDFVGEGRVTLQAADAPIVVRVTVLRNGQQGQRILFNQSDGKSWDGKLEHLEPVSRRTLDFVETQFARGLPNLVKASARNAVVTDGGVRNNVQFLNLRESNGTPTRYSIDVSTSRLMRFEFQRVPSRDASGKITPNFETYVYSDFRSVNGVVTPFKVEHYTNGKKQEELEFSSVRYVNGARDAALLPSGGQR